MNGPVIKALLNLVANYIEKNGADLAEMLINIILQKINPQTATFAAPDDPVAVEFSRECDEIIANQGD